MADAAACQTIQQHISLGLCGSGGAARAGGTHARVYRAGDWSVTQIDGELDNQSVPAEPRLLTDEGALVVFNLTSLTFMDCSGLRLLDGTARTASQRRGRVRDRRLTSGAQSGHAPRVGAGD